MLSFLRSPAPAALSVQDVENRLTKGDLILVDVREVAEVKASGKAKGAINIPLSVLGLKANPAMGDCQLNPHKGVAVYCASGGRSAMAAQSLAQLGYAEVHNLGGFGDWVRAGGQVERI